VHAEHHVVVGSAARARSRARPRQWKLAAFIIQRRKGMPEVRQRIMKSRLCRCFAKNPATKSSGSPSRVNALVCTYAHSGRW